MKKCAAALAFALALFSSAAQTRMEAATEAICGFRVETDRIVFTVFNSGYTDKTSFTLSVEKKGLTAVLTLVRLKADPGKMVPEPLEIPFTREELAAKADIRGRLTVANPFSSIRQ